jgi:hypothetical protein
VDLNPRIKIFVNREGEAAKGLGKKVEAKPVVETVTPEPVVELNAEPESSETATE